MCAVVYCYDYWGHYVLVTGFTNDGDVKIFMQYNSKQKDTFIEKYLNALNNK